MFALLGASMGLSGRRAAKIMRQEQRDMQRLRRRLEKRRPQ
jgi:hypothetical protein